MNAPDHAFCPVYDSIQLLQEKWVLHIVRALLEGPHGFNDLARAVGGVNTTTLSARLEHLDRVGVVVKTIESTMPPRTRYELSAAGRALQQVVDAIDSWAREHMPACRAAEATGAPASVAAARSGARHPANE